MLSKFRNNLNSFFKIFSNFFYKKSENTTLVKLHTEINIRVLNNSWTKDMRMNLQNFQLLRFSRRKFNKDPTLLELCSMNFIPNIIDNKMIVYFLYDKYYTCEYRTISDSIVAADIVDILSMIDVEDIYQYNSFIFFVLTKLLSISFNNGGFAVEGSLAGRKCHLMFVKKEIGIINFC